MKQKDEQYYIGPDGKEVSAGVLIVTKDNEVLCCHPTGKGFADGTYDLPKGHIDKGETPEDAAVREVKEETGLKLDKNKLKDLGEFHYTAEKNLHLYWYDIDEIDVKKLECTSNFEMYGRSLPEVNGYKLTPLSDISPYYKVIQKVLVKIL